MVYLPFEASGFLQNLVCAARLAKEDLERRNVRIPLDQRRHWPEPRHRCPVELPNRRADGVVVRVDHEITVVLVTGQVNLPDSLPGKGIEIPPGIESMVAGIDVEIVDIEEDSAVGLLDDSPHELGLG